MLSNDVGQTGSCKLYSMQTSNLQFCSVVPVACLLISVASDSTLLVTLTDEEPTNKSEQMVTKPKQ